MLSATAIGVQVLLHGARFVGGPRYAAFGKDFVEENKHKKEFQAMVEDHKKATGDEHLAKGGYPVRAHRPTRAVSTAPSTPLRRSRVLAAPSGTPS